MISTKKTAHSVAQIKENNLIREELACGLIRPIAHQIPIPEMAPTTFVKIKKKRLKSFKKSMTSSRLFLRAQASVVGKKIPPPTAN